VSTNVGYRGQVESVGGDIAGMGDRCECASEQHHRKDDFVNGQDCECVCILALKVERGLRDASDQDWLAYFQRFSVHLPFEDNVSVVVCSVELNFH
jgi:hypothetical protein